MTEYFDKLMILFHDYFSCGGYEVPATKILIIALHDYYSLELELECLELVALGTS